MIGFGYRLYPSYNGYNGVGGKGIDKMIDPSGRNRGQGQYSSETMLDQVEGMI